MKCSNALPLLDLLSDGALETKDSALVLDHLSNCESCHEEWTAHESLRAKILQAKTDTEVPEGLMEKISEKLRYEDRNKNFTQLTNRNLLALVACLVLLAIPLALSVTQSQTGTPIQSALADVLIDELSSKKHTQSEPDTSAVATAVGYDIKRVHLPSWKMQGCEVYDSNSQNKIARFEFISNLGPTERKLTCYQAKQGTIKADAAELKNINGKQVRLGHRGAMTYGLWTQNERDYLFISDIPLSQLEEVIGQA